MLVPADDVDLASDALWQLHPSAVHEEHVGSKVRLTADPADAVDPAEIAAPSRGWSAEVLELDGDGHLDAWRAWARPLRAGRRILLQPAWLPSEANADDLVVVLDPGRAFGSGSHPSTRLVLGALERLVRPGARVLDVGTGSGVLAVAACLLGAEAVVAVDIDPAAIDAAMANARANGVAPQVEVSDRPVGDVEGTFDLVLANIGAGVLTELATDLVARSGGGGSVVLAGLLDDQVLAVVERFALDGASVREQLSEDGWSAVVLDVAGERGGT